MGSRFAQLLSPIPAKIWISCDKTSCGLGVEGFKKNIDEADSSIVEAQKTVNNGDIFAHDRAWD